VKSGFPSENATVQEFERSQCSKVKKRAPAMNPGAQVPDRATEIARPGTGETQSLQDAIPARSRIDQDQFEQIDSIAPAPGLAWGLHPHRDDAGRKRNSRERCDGLTPGP
jgi:hypothetical protein